MSLRKPDHRPQSQPKLDRIFLILDASDESAASDIRSILHSDTTMESAADRINVVLQRVGISGRDASVSRGAVATWRSRNGWACKPGSRVRGYEEAPPSPSRVPSAAQAQPRDSFEFDPLSGEGTATVHERIDGGVRRTVDDLLRAHGFDPDEYEIIGAPRVSGWDVAYRDSEGEMQSKRMEAHRFHFVRKGLHLDLPALFSAANSYEPVAPAAPLIDMPRSAFVVALGDIQLGKGEQLFGSIGETLTRLSMIRRQVVQSVVEGGHTDALIVDAGDLIEGDQSSGPQRAISTNSLSLVQQIDVATTVVAEYVRDLLSVVPGRVIYATVPSNHAQLRRGAEQLGLSGRDDFGVLVAKLVAKQFAHEPRFSIAIPEETSEQIRVDLYGHGVGVVHGHRFRPGGQEKWLAGQTLHHATVTGSEVIVSGHYHHYAVSGAGIAKDGRFAWWVQTPALDSGSDWFANSTGSVSQPGAVTFVVTERDGFLLDSLRVVSAPHEKFIIDRSAPSAAIA